jgi:hypothetical protein
MTTTTFPFPTVPTSQEAVGRRVHLSNRHGDQWGEGVIVQIIAVEGPFSPTFCQCGRRFQVRLDTGLKAGETLWGDCEDITYLDTGRNGTQD